MPWKVSALTCRVRGYCPQKRSNPVTDRYPVGSSSRAREKSFWYIDVREAGGRGAQDSFIAFSLGGSLKPAWDITEDQVLFCQRLACLAESLATQSCALLIFQLLISARSEISLAMTHGSSWPQRQVCGQYSLFLALFLALTGHPSWESPLPMSQPLALAPFILCC